MWSLQRGLPFNRKQSSMIFLIYLLYYFVFSSLKICRMYKFLNICLNTRYFLCFCQLPYSWLHFVLLCFALLVFICFLLLFVFPPACLLDFVPLWLLLLLFLFLKLYYTHYVLCALVCELCVCVSPCFLVVINLCPNLESPSTCCFIANCGTLESPPHSLRWIIMSKIVKSWQVGSPLLSDFISDYIHPVYLRFDCTMSSNVTFPNFILDSLHIMSLEDLGNQ